MRIAHCLLVALVLSGCGEAPALGRSDSLTANRTSIRTPVAQSLAARTPAPTWTPSFQPVELATPPPTATPVATLPPATFGFIFTYGACVDSRVDTYVGIFHRDGTMSAPPVTVPISLTAADMERIQQAVDRIDFFGYPTEFTLRPSIGTGNAAMVTPSNHFVFQVREGSRQHVVYWDDNIIGVANARADHLRVLADLIERTARGAPAVAALPPFQPGCA